MFRYYEILGVSRNADDAAIRRAYHKQSLKLHPDKPGGSKEAFQELDRANRVLGDAKSRVQYDRLGVDLRDNENDAIDAQICAMGLKITKISCLAMLRTAASGAFVLLLPRYWPVRWCQGIISIGWYGYGLLERHAAPEEKKNAGIETGDYGHRARRYGGSLTAIFAASQLAYQTSFGKRLRLAWLYEAGVLFATSGCLETYSAATPRSMLGAQCLGCFVVARCLGSSVWPWFYVLLFESLTSILAPCIFSVVGTLVTKVVESKLDRYAREVQELVEKETARSKQLQRRVTGLEASLESNAVKLEKYIKYSSKAKEIVDRNVEQKKKLERRIAELEANR